MRHTLPKKLAMIGTCCAALVLTLTTGLGHVAANPLTQANAELKNAQPASAPANTPTAQGTTPNAQSTAATKPSETGNAPASSAGDPEHATIIINTVPATTANVFWGRKLLGRITPKKPLVLVRPRDSGPLDVMVRAEGYLPVQTRAHTFSDNRVVVKLTPRDRIHELLGYRAPLDAGVSEEQTAALDALDGADAGVPAQPAPIPAPTPTTQPQPQVPFQVVPSQPAPLAPLAP